MPDQHFEYEIIKAKSHDDLAKLINNVAEKGWEPVNAYAWGTGAHVRDNGIHFALLRRPKP